MNSLAEAHVAKDALRRGGEGAREADPARAAERAAPQQAAVRPLADGRRGHHSGARRAGRVPRRAAADGDRGAGAGLRQLRRADAGVSIASTSTSRPARARPRTLDADAVRRAAAPPRPRRSHLLAHLMPAVEIAAADLAEDEATTSTSSPSTSPRPRSSPSTAWRRKRPSTCAPSSSARRRTSPRTSGCSASCSKKATSTAARVPRRRRTWQSSTTRATAPPIAAVKNEFVSRGRALRAGAAGRAGAVVCDGVRRSRSTTLPAATTR